MNMFSGTFSICECDIFLVNRMHFCICECAPAYANDFVCM